DGDERGFRDRDCLWGDPCARRDGDFRRAGKKKPRRGAGGLRASGLYRAMPPRPRADNLSAKPPARELVPASGKYFWGAPTGRFSLHLLRNFSYRMTIRVPGPIFFSNPRNRPLGIATQPAVGANPGRARWMKTALPRPATRGRVL